MSAAMSCHDSPTEIERITVTIANRSTALRAPVAALFAASSIAHAQSFDCAKASNAVEHAICGTQELRDLDTLLAKEFATALGASPALRTAIVTGQRQWITDRNKQCGARGETLESTASCLVPLYRARVEELKSGAAVRAASLYGTESCRKIADAYSPLAASHPGESPLSVLSASPASGLSLVRVQASVPPGSRFCLATVQLQWTAEPTEAAGIVIAQQPTRAFTELIASGGTS